MRKDIFDRVVAFRDTVGLGGLTDEQKRLVDKLILHGKRNGKTFPKLFIGLLHESICHILPMHSQPVRNIKDACKVVYIQPL